MLTSLMVLALMQQGADLTMRAAAPPVACQLDAIAPEQRERHAFLLRTLRERVIETRELPKGFAFNLPADAVLFQQVAEWIALERGCCPFIDFELKWTRDGAMRLTLTGSREAKAVIAQEIATNEQARREEGGRR